MPVARDAETFSSLFNRVTSAEAWLRRITGGSIVVVGIYIYITVIRVDWRDSWARALCDFARESRELPRMDAVATGGVVAE